MKLVIDKEQLPVEIFSTMGCRTANGADINFTKEYYKENIRQVLENGKIDNSRLLSAAQKDGRGNICPATIILPTLAMQCKKKFEKKGNDAVIEEFFKLLETKIEECKDSLVERFNYICSQSPKSATFMWENSTMKGYIEKEGIASAMKHGTLAIGKLGIAETLQILIGKNHLSEEGMELAKRIEQMYVDKCNEYKKKYHLNFGIYETPAESLCYTAMKKFQKKYGKIPNISDREFFTNSVHVPVWEEISAFDKIDTESQLTGYSTAGSILYVEIGEEVQHNTKALEQIVNYAMEKDVPYFAVNVPNDMCEDCGFQGNIPDDVNCPHCGSSNVTRLRRVTGYISQDYHHFNLGKQAEVRARKKLTK